MKTKHLFDLETNDQAAGCGRREVSGTRLARCERQQHKNVTYAVVSKPELCEGKLNRGERQRGKNCKLKTHNAVTEDTEKRRKKQETAGRDKR